MRETTWRASSPSSLWSSLLLGGERSSVDVSVTKQLKFLRDNENAEVPQIPSLDRVLQIPVVLQRRARTVQTVQKPEIPQRSSWSRCSRARCYATTGAWGWTVPKYCGGSAVAVGAALGAC